MKKTLKITSIILGCLMIIAVLVYAFGLQFIVKVYVSNNYEHINCVTKEFPYYEVQIPENWKTIEYEGMTLKVPEEVHQLHPDDEIEAKRKNFSDAEKNPDTTVFFVGKFEEDIISILNSDKYTFVEKDIQKAMKSVDYKYPKNMYELYDCIFNVTSKDFGILKCGKSPLLIITIANTKEMIYNTYTVDCDEVYSFETKNGKGFLSLYGKPNDRINKYSYIIELYDKDNLNKSNSVIVKSTNKETALKIAKSAEIVEE